MNIRDISKAIMAGSDDKYSEELRLEVDLLDTRWQHVLQLAHLQNESLISGLKKSQDFIKALDDLSEWVQERHVEYVVSKKYNIITEETQFKDYEDTFKVIMYY